MAQDKNKNGSKNDFSAEAKFLKEALVAMGILSAMLSLSLAGILAYYAEELDAKGYTAWEIFKSKLWRVASLAPFALLFAYILAIYIPKNISIKNYFTVHQSTSNPTTETEYRENVENIKSKIENAEMEISSAKSSKSIAIDDNKRLVREYNRAKTVEEQSELEEQNKRVEKDFKEANENISKYTAELPKLKEKLQIAREDLEAFREGRPTSFDKPIVTSDRTLETSETTNENKSKFMFYALVFLLVSIPLSYPMIYFTRSEHKSLSRIQFALKWLNEVVISRMEYIGLYPIMLLSKYVHKDSDETIRPSNAKDVMQLGIEKNAYLTDRNLNYHTQIIGGSGSGKTNLLKVAIEDRVAKGHSVIFFDFKADVELMDWIAGLVEYYNRKEDLVMLSMSDPKMSFAYNPIKHGTETEISSQLMNSFVWSEPYYKNKAEGALLIILKAFCYQRDIGGREFHLGELYRFLNDASFRMDIVSAISLLNYPEMYRGDLKRICEELTTSKKDDYQILITQIGKILNSSAGDIVANKIGNDEEFEFKDSMESGKIAYLFMNSLKLKETASVMGKLMLQDLMKTVGNIYDDRNAIKRPTTLIIDEFASFATPDFGEFIEKARGAGISVIVAYQSRKSLDYIGENLALKINENTANKIAFQIQDSEDVEWFCSLLGTKTTKKETYQAEEGIFWDNKTGQKSVREVEEYVVHPNQIKKLKLGQAFLYCSKIDPHHCIMNIKMANDFFGKYERQSLVSQNLRKVDLIKTDQPKEKGNEVNNYF